jgi:hypothetical protein
MARQIVVEILGDASKFNNATKQATGSATSFSNVIAGIGQGIGIAGFGAVANMASSAASAIIDYTQGSIEAASGLNEALALTTQVFETNQGAITAWAKTGADAFGMSEREASNFASGFGTALKNVGLSLDDTTAKSKDLTELAGDLGSAFNKSSEQAATALRSGLLGESEPLRQFGVFLDEAKVSAWLLADGQKKMNGVWTDAQKVTARYNIILGQTADSQGMFGRDANSLEDTQKKLNASLENVSAAIGQKLLPMVVKLAEFATNDVIPAVENMGVALDYLSWRTAEETRLTKEGIIAYGYNAEGILENRVSAEAYAMSLNALAESTRLQAVETARWTGLANLSATAAEEAGKAVAEEAKQGEEAAKSLVASADKILRNWKGVADWFRTNYTTNMDTAFNIVDARAGVSANNQEAADLRKKLSSGNLTASEKADINERIADLDRDTAEHFANLQETGVMTNAEYKAWSGTIESLARGTKGVVHKAFDDAKRDIENLRLEATTPIVIDVLYLSRYAGNENPTKLASGGYGSGLAWVGEEGPELVNLPTGSYVHNNSESMRMASNTGSMRTVNTSSSNNGTVIVNINGAQDVRAIMLELRRELTRQGMSFA